MVRHVDGRDNCTGVDPVAWSNISPCALEVQEYASTPRRLARFSSVVEAANGRHQEHVSTPRRGHVSSVDDGGADPRHSSSCDSFSSSLSLVLERIGRLEEHQAKTQQCSLEAQELGRRATTQVEKLRHDTAEQLRSLVVGMQEERSRRKAEEVDIRASMDQLWSCMADCLPALDDLRPEEEEEPHQLSRHVAHATVPMVRPPPMDEGAFGRAEKELARRLEEARKVQASVRYEVAHAISEARAFLDGEWHVRCRQDGEPSPQEDSGVQNRSSPCTDCVGKLDELDLRFNSRLEAVEECSRVILHLLSANVREQQAGQNLSTGQLLVSDLHGEWQRALDDSRSRGNERAQSLCRTLCKEFETSIVSQAIAEVRAEACATLRVEVQEMCDEAARKAAQEVVIETAREASLAAVRDVVANDLIQPSCVPKAPPSEASTQPADSERRLSGLSASSSESLVTTESSEPAHSVNGFLMRLAEERVQREDFEQATAKCLEEWFSKLSMDVDAKIAQLAKGLEDQARDGAVVRQRLDEVLPTLADVWHRLCTETPAKVREPASRTVEARVEERTSTASRRVSDHGPKGARSAHGHGDASSGYSVRAKGSRQEVVVATRPSVTAPSPGSSLVTTAGDSSVGVSRRHVEPHVHPHSAAFLSSSTHRRVAQSSPVRRQQPTGSAVIRSAHGDPAAGVSPRGPVRHQKPALAGRLTWKGASDAGTTGDVQVQGPVQVQGSSIGVSAAPSMPNSPLFSELPIKSCAETSLICGCTGLPSPATFGLPERLSAAAARASAIPEQSTPRRAISVPCLPQSMSNFSGRPA